MLVCIGGRVVKVDASMEAVLEWLLAGASVGRDATGLGGRRGGSQVPHNPSECRQDGATVMVGSPGVSG
jgi:hypothetical protein